MAAVWNNLQRRQDGFSATEPGSAADDWTAEVLDDVHDLFASTLPSHISGPYLELRERNAHGDPQPAWDYLQNLLDESAAARLQMNSPADARPAIESIVAEPDPAQLPNDVADGPDSFWGEAWSFDDL